MARLFATAPKVGVTVEKLSLCQEDLMGLVLSGKGVRGWLGGVGGR